MKDRGGNVKVDRALDEEIAEGPHQQRSAA
jgi:hypothetical protein